MENKELMEKFGRDAPEESLGYIYRLAKNQIQENNGKNLILCKYKHRLSYNRHLAYSGYHWDQKLCSQIKKNNMR